MSSRALRRAQKELEERQRLEQLAQEEEDDETDEDDVVPPAKQSSLFALLGEAEQDDEEEEDEEDEEDVESPPAVQEERPVTVAPQAKSKKSKKRKKKGKSKSAAPASEKPAQTMNADMDEIDRALLALNITSGQNTQSKDASQLTANISEEMQQLYSVLSVDTQHLHASNEMRKLFGRAALQASHDADDGARRQRRGGVAGAGVGRNVPGNRNGPSLGLRRNIFIQGKEEWPRATTGGLSMEVVERRDDGCVEYRFVHNAAYQSVQRQFETCVASMDPDRMVQLLQFNPYHISTLLQVSEIAKQQRDNAAAGDLLERALFCFGRAVHSTFANNIAQGKARLDFRRPENREFWLAVWRYIGNLGVRATWRTASEWAKLLLSFDPEGDPYCLRLLIDQLALRGRQPQDLVDLVNTDHLQRVWKIPPNLAMSVALAHHRLNDHEKARSTLKLAIQQYPWVAARLCKALDISPIPKSIWGKEPNGTYQELLCQLYVTKAKDLWNTPEATSLLVSVAASCEDVGSGEDPYWLAAIPEVDLARHVILSDDRTLLSFLDPKIKEKYTSIADPLAPEDNLPSYQLWSTGNQDIQSLNAPQITAEILRLREYFDRMTQFFNRDEDDVPLTQDEMARQLEGMGSTLAELRRNTNRFQMLRERVRAVDQAQFSSELRERVPVNHHQSDSENEEED
ncbi:DUF654-domain-containing protein [Delitschia confertaspora ATCC 74209]|uniref:DUF654-domain-containing protein n=1 Tax=Delitschia confertaspora ATCC 74209 TaxID=1513339 RepID=A0A9P4JSY1_9PLEO|nr:DUF654-domain-containing protein [Delitschia confertaspora ATCC 74209]